MLSYHEVNIGRALFGAMVCPHSDFRIGASIVGRTPVTHFQHTNRSITVAFSEFRKSVVISAGRGGKVNLFCDSVC
jgi:hypothetical protein